MGEAGSEDEWKLQPGLEVGRGKRDPRVVSIGMEAGGKTKGKLESMAPFG